MKYLNRVAILMALCLTLFACEENVTGSTNNSSTQTPPTVTTIAVTNVQNYTAYCTGEVVEEGSHPVTAYGFCYSTENRPTIEDFITVDGEGIGEFESLLTDLQPNTTYYVRAYATNKAGTTYGSQKTFTTKEVAANQPVATTVSAHMSDAQYSSAGFTMEGSSTRYSYLYEISFTVSFSGTAGAQEIGFIMGDDYWHYNTISDRTIDDVMYLYANSSSTSTYIQAYIKKADGSYIYGDRINVSCQYTSYTPVVRTLNLYQTDAAYSSSGFLASNGNRYSYVFSYSFELSFSNTNYASEIGFLFDYDSSTGNYGYKYYYEQVADKTTFHDTFVNYSNYSSSSVSITAYALTYDGTWILGNTLSISLYYPFYGYRAPQKLEAIYPVDDLKKYHSSPKKPMPSPNEYIIPLGGNISTDNLLYFNVQK